MREGEGGREGGYGIGVEKGVIKAERQGGREGGQG
jgi:hypothetical protein